MTHQRRLWEWIRENFPGSCVFIILHKHTPRCFCLSAFGDLFQNHRFVVCATEDQSDRSHFYSSSANRFGLIYHQWSAKHLQEQKLVGRVYFHPQKWQTSRYWNLEAWDEMWFSQIVSNLSFKLFQCLDNQWLQAVKFNGCFGRKKKSLYYRFWLKVCVKSRIFSSRALSTRSFSFPSGLIWSSPANIRSLETLDSLLISHAEGDVTKGALNIDKVLLTLTLAPPNFSRPMAKLPLEPCCDVPARTWKHQTGNDERDSGTRVKDVTLAVFFRKSNSFLTDLTVTLKA